MLRRGVEPVDGRAKDSIVGGEESRVMERLTLAAGRRRVYIDMPEPVNGIVKRQLSDVLHSLSEYVKRQCQERSQINLTYKC